MYKLNEMEEFTLNAWLSKPKQKNLLKNGKLALVFSQSSMGGKCIAKILSDSGEEAEFDITDYAAW